MASNLAACSCMSGLLMALPGLVSSRVIGGSRRVECWEGTNPLGSHAVPHHVTHAGSATSSLDQYGSHHGSVLPCQGRGTHSHAQVLVTPPESVPWGQHSRGVAVSLKGLALSSSTRCQRRA